MRIRARAWTSSGKVVRKFEADRGINPATGIRERKLCDTRGEAKDWLKKSPKSKDAGRKTLADAVTRLRDRCEADGLERVTIEGYDGLAEKHIVPYWKKTTIPEITPKAVETFRGHLLKTKSKSVTLHVMAVFKMLLNQAVTEAWVDVSPAASLKKLHKPRERTQIEIMSRDELRAIIKATSPKGKEKALLGQALIQTAIFSGLRASELRALRWRDLFFDELPPFIRVERRADRWNKEGSPKSAAGRRDVQIPRHLVAILQAWEKTCPKSERGLVFPNGDGGHQSNANISQRIWHPVQIALGMTRPKNMGRMSERTKSRLDKNPALAVAGRYGLHTLRHAFATLQIDAGVDPKKLQEQMGHATLGLTMDTYGHLWKNARRDQARLSAIEGWIRAAAS